MFSATFPVFCRWVCSAMRAAQARVGCAVFLAIGVPLSAKTKPWTRTFARKNLELTPVSTRTVFQIGVPSPKRNGRFLGGLRIGGHGENMAGGIWRVRITFGSWARGREQLRHHVRSEFARVTFSLRAVTCEGILEIVGGSIRTECCNAWHRDRSHFAQRRASNQPFVLGNRCGY